VYGNFKSYVTDYALDIYVQIFVIKIFLETSIIFSSYFLFLLQGPPLYSSFKNGDVELSDSAPDELNRMASIRLHQKYLHSYNKVYHPDEVIIPISSI